MDKSTLEQRRAFLKLLQVKLTKELFPSLEEWIQELEEEIKKA